MRKRTNKFLIRLNDEELKKLNDDVAKSGLSREVYLRKIMNGVVIKEKHDKVFYETINEIRTTGNAIRVMSRIALENHDVDTQKLIRMYKELQLIISKILTGNY